MVDVLGGGKESYQNGAQALRALAAQTTKMPASRPTTQSHKSPGDDEADVRLNEPSFASTVQ